LATSPAVETRQGTTAGRKADHIRINLEEDVSAKGVTSGFDEYRFQHVALPELDLSRIDTTTSLFGLRLKAPVLISCMTGGVPEAERINHILAETAQEFGFALGLGSARVLLERPEVLSSFDVRKQAPNVPLLANLGAVQLNKGVGVDDCRRVVDLLQADALVLHLNALQEALQIEGDTDFSGLLAKIATVCSALDVPVIAKEIGWGIAPDLVRRLLDAGVSAVDVAGAGGTSWSEVERHRLNSRVKARVAAAFAGWGIPTAQAIRDARATAPTSLIFASGGIRDGVDVAKAIGLGADIAGIAGPFLRAAAAGQDEALQLAEELTEVLTTLLFVVGCPTIGDLRGTIRLVPVQAGGAVTYVEELEYSTAGTRAFLDITDDVEAIVARSGIAEGIAHIFSNHTTAAVRINENEPLLIEDFRAFLDRLAPAGQHLHNDLDRRLDVGPHEPRNGHAHLQHLVLSSSETVAVGAGRLRLGRWQRVFLIELDSARERWLTVQIIGR
jgi:isopentenyl-diphosphate delta-isomerase